ncbi:hypothetical protein F4V91_10015 [Neorhizobium galegae]|uniref:Uncharacterized protein n=1 Tax=Neorhizobium galegae TaxID=399 RepID=A0A6A1TQ68_NEOGA|nr:hypothetical protein [Neorhizobium galegae]KAB1086733.1 hypothetical protein F4V91_10015 [Neorhizobium galegae]
MNEGEKSEITAGMKAMVLAIVVCVLGVFVGMAGLIGDWAFAKSIGFASLVGLAVIFWISTEVRTETLNRFLYGSKNQSRD